MASSLARKPSAKDQKSPRQAAKPATRSSLMGKFFRAVERMSEESGDAMAREKAIDMNIRLHQVNDYVTDTYTALRQATDQLHKGYTSSKATVNVATRYSQWKKLIKHVLTTDRQQRSKVKLPEQRDNETPLEFIMKVATVLQRDVGRPAVLPPDQLEKRYKSKTSVDVNKENEEVQQVLHKQLKRYFTLRTLIAQLEHDYEESKMYPMIPRYMLVKGMIKRLFRSPQYINLLHDGKRPSL